MGSSRDGVGVLLEGFCSLIRRDWGLNLRDGEESDDLQVAYLPRRQEMGCFFWRHWTVTGGSIHFSRGSVLFNSSTNCSP